MLSSIVFCGCVSNLIKDDVTDPADEIVIYDFANWYVRAQNLSYLYEQATYIVFESEEETRATFEEQLKYMYNSAECKHFMRQYGMLAKLHWDATRLDNISLMSKEVYQNAFREYSHWEPNKNKSICAMSRPLVSADKKTVVAYIEQSRYSECGHGGFAIFTKTAEGWKKVDGNFSIWME